MKVTMFRDPRHFQMLFQSIFLSYGIFYLHWDQRWWLYITYFSLSIATQTICEIIFTGSGVSRFSPAWWRKLSFGMPSAIISAFGLSLFLKTNSFLLAACVSILAISSKYLLRINKKHVFNPSALGIVVAAWLTNEAWVNPGQWGNGFIQFFGVLILGLLVVTKVQKLDVSIAFLATYASLLFIRQVLYLGWPVDFFLQSISTGTLLVFTFFMISDPKTTPDHARARAIWAMMVAGLAFYLSSFEFVYASPVLALVLLQPLVPLIDKIFSAQKFQWPGVSRHSSGTMPVVHQISISNTAKP